MRLGKLKRSYYTGEGVEGINWVKPGEWIRTLGIPVGEDFNEDDFIMEKYLKCKKLLARWGLSVTRALTGFGRAQVAGTLVYSRFRFYSQAMVITLSDLARQEEIKY